MRVWNVYISPGELNTKVGDSSFTSVEGNLWQKPRKAMLQQMRSLKNGN